MVETTRRELFRLARGAAAIGGAAVLAKDALARLAPVLAAVNGRDPEDVARDEDFWFRVQQAFPVDRSLINLNNGGTLPAPSSALDLLHRVDDHVNHAPAYYLFQDLKPEYENVRRLLARTFGCDAEEIAITRNATEALDNVIFGLDLARGDEVVTTDQDYPTMLSALRQREARDGIVLKALRMPVPAPSQDELFARITGAITDRTRLVLVCQVVNLTGQIYPVRRIIDFARAKNIPVLVDGAHAFGQFPFTRDDLDCDYFGTSLHKWINAPVGAGMLYVKKDKIGSLWPMFGQLGAKQHPTDTEAEQKNDIRKFEGIGTHPAGHRLAISEALTLHESIGAARKAARLRYLRDRWADRIASNPRVKFLASRAVGESCAIATVAIDGITATALQQWLFAKWRIIATMIDHADVKGLRVTPAIHTTLAEVDLFADALEVALKDGVPEAAH